MKIIDRPQDLGQNNDRFQLNIAFRIDEPGKQHPGKQRKQTDGACPARQHRQTGLQEDEQQLQPDAALNFRENQIPQNADQTGNKPAGSPQNQIAQSQKAKLEALEENDPLPFPDKADHHHQDTSQHGYQISQKQHKTAPYKILPDASRQAVCFSEAACNAMVAAIVHSSGCV